MLNNRNLPFLFIIGIIFVLLGLFLINDAEPQELNPQLSEVSSAQLIGLGEKLYLNESSTCRGCHEKQGSGAPSLKHPKTWKSYQYAGGHPSDTLHLIYNVILNGAKWTNLTFNNVIAPAFPTVKKFTYNEEMKGLTSDAMQQT